MLRLHTQVRQFGPQASGQHLAFGPSRVRRRFATPPSRRLYQPLYQPKWLGTALPNRVPMPQRPPAASPVDSRTRLRTPIPLTAASPSDGVNTVGSESLSHVLRKYGQPELVSALDNLPGYAALVGLQEEVLERLQVALGVVPTQTKHTDANGIMKTKSLQSGRAALLFRSYRSPPHASKTSDSTTTSPQLRTMTQAFSYYQTPFGEIEYTKTSVSAPDSWPTPQLDVEFSGTASQLIFYVGLGPKANLFSDIPYLDHYYRMPPPPLPSNLVLPPLPPLPPPLTAGQATGPVAAAPVTAANASGDATSVSLPRRSFQDIEAEARKQPGFSPFVSSSLWTRAAAVGALCFSVAWDGGRNAQAMAAMRHYVAEMTDLWLAHVLEDAKGTAVSEADEWTREQWRRAGLSMRNQMKYDPQTPMMIRILGEEQVAKCVKVVAGEE